MAAKLHKVTDTHKQQWQHLHSNSTIYVHIAVASFTHGDSIFPSTLALYTVAVNYEQSCSNVTMVATVMIVNAIALKLWV